MTESQEAAVERFLARVVTEPNPDHPHLGECHIFTPAYESTSPGARWPSRFFDGERITTTGRFAYETFVGPIPSGHTITRACGDARCVNPSHLRASPFATRGPQNALGASERFEGYTERSGPLPRLRKDLGACWQWTGPIGGRGRPGFMADENRLVRPDVWAYEQSGQVLQPGYQLYGLCDNPLCVNPRHMVPVKRRRVSGTRGVIDYLEGKLLRGYVASYTEEGSFYWSPLLANRASAEVWLARAREAGISGGKILGPEVFYRHVRDSKPRRTPKRENPGQEWMDELLRIGEAARILSVAPQTLRRWCGAGLVPYALWGKRRYLWRSDTEKLAEMKVVLGDRWGEVAGESWRGRLDGGY